MSNLCTENDRGKLFESKDLRQLGNLGEGDLIGYALRMALLGSHMSIAGGYYKAVEAAKKAGCDSVPVFKEQQPVAGESYHY
jgi:hypothetical protein